jgi:hypothetical protein
MGCAKNTSNTAAAAQLSHQTNDAKTELRTKMLGQYSTHFSTESDISRRVSFHCTSEESKNHRCTKKEATNSSISCRGGILRKIHSESFSKSLPCEMVSGHNRSPNNKQSMHRDSSVVDKKKDMVSGRDGPSGLRVGNMTFTFSRPPKEIEVRNPSNEVPNKGA